MTNCDSKMEVQPIRYVDKDTKTTQYFFEDKDILREMEKYHIQKESSISKDELATEIDKRKKENKNVDNLINIKSSKISEHFFDMHGSRWTRQHQREPDRQCRPKTND